MLSVLMPYMACVSLPLLVWLTLLILLSSFIKTVSVHSWLVLKNMAWMVPIWFEISVKTQRQIWVHSRNPTSLPQPATAPTQIPVSHGMFYRKHIVETLCLPFFLLSFRLLLCCDN